MQVVLGCMKGDLLKLGLLRWLPCPTSPLMCQCDCCDWHISGDVGQGSVADSVACMAETPHLSIGHGFGAWLSVLFLMSPLS